MNDSLLRYCDNAIVGVRAALNILARLHLKLPQAPEIVAVENDDEVFGKSVEHHIPALRPKKVRVSQHGARKVAKLEWAHVLHARVAHVRHEVLEADRDVHQDFSSVRMVL